MRPMADIIDLTLLTDAQRYLRKLLDARGVAYFLRKEGARLFELEPSKVELVVRVAARSRSTRGGAPHPRAVEHCRQQIRRELIRHVAAAMLKTGL
jgi:hypothetical protein